VHANNVVGEGVTHIYGGNDASHVVVGFGGYDGAKVVVVWVATLCVRDDIVIALVETPWEKKTIHPKDRNLEIHLVLNP